jgi:hypothetical protein
MIEEFEVNCMKCNKPIKLKWENGIISEPHFVLIASWVFHSECCDMLLDEYPVDTMNMEEDDETDW